MPEPDSAFRTAQSQFDEAANRLNLDPALRELLRWPRREFHFTIPMRMDDGSTRVWKAYRVHYNDALGPCMGGLRWHAGQTPDMVRAQAAAMTWRAAAAGLPAGGSHGAVACDAKRLSDHEKQRLARAWVRAAAPFLGEDRDIPFPGIYTSPGIMVWMRDEYEVLRGAHHPAAFAGKPVALGGSRGRMEAAARGGVSCVRDAGVQQGLDPSAMSFAVQGFGNAGQHAALLHPRIVGGGKLVAASDTGGGVMNPDGLDPAALVEHKRKTGRLKGFPGARPVGNSELLELDVAVLYPAAMEGVITQQNADRVRARIVCELADSPTTPEADRVLFLKGVQVIPDLIASAGGVIVSYLEHVQGLGHHAWPGERVLRDLDGRISEAFDAVCRMQKAQNVLPRQAAYLVAVGRVAEAVRLRGWA